MKKYIFLVSVLFLALFSKAQDKQITILSINDMHAQMEYFPKFAAIADSLRAIDSDLIVLSAGDNRTGNPYNDRAEIPGYPMVAMMNAVGFQASAIGNHEWDNQWQGFRQLVNLADFPFLCSNIEIPDSMRLHVYPYKIMNVHGVRIGILGTIQVSDLGIPDCHPDKVVGIKFPKPDDIIPQYKWMRDQCDVMILLSHDGYTADIATAEKFPWIDVIVGGHSHTLVPANDIHNGVLITQAKYKFYYANITKIQVSGGKVTSKKTELVDVRGFAHENDSIAKMLAGFSHNPSLLKVAGKINRDLRTREELGCLMCDAILDETGSDIALQNGGGVRLEYFKAGDMTIEDVLRLDPFGNDAIVYQLTGQEVADYILSCYEVDERHIPYVGGIKYTVTWGQDGKPQNISINMLNGQKFDLKKKYKFVTNSYISSIIKSKHSDPGKDTYITCSDMLIKYLQKKGSVDYQGVVRTPSKI